MFLDVPLWKVPQVLHIRFLKETIKSSRWKPKSYAKLSAGDEDLSVHVAGNRSEQVVELQCVNGVGFETGPPEHVLEIV